MPVNSHSTGTIISEAMWPSVVSPKAAQILSLLWQLEKTQWWSAEQLEKAQFKQLGELLGSAYRDSEFYRAQLEGIGYKLGMQITRKFWNTLPVLSRDMLQQEPDKLKCNNYPREHGKLLKLTSSGSTGKPVTIYRPKVTALFYEAHTFRDHLWHRKNLDGKHAFIRGFVDKKKALYPEGARKQGWARPLSLLGDAYLLRIDTPIHDQIEWLQRVDPDYLLTHPTNLEALIRIAKEENIQFNSLKQISTMSEPMGVDLEEQCFDVLKIHVNDIYSCQEAGVLASRCPEFAGYHVQSEHVMLEILDKDNQPCEKGKTGRVVVTDLHNFAMPLIRYELGDYAEVGAVCPCGRGLPVINKILGRKRNLLTLPTGEQFWPLLFTFDFNELSGAKIKQTQVIQKDLESIEVKIVVDGKLDADQENLIRMSLIESLKYEFQIDFTYCEKIERSESGKFEEFLSLVS